MVKLVTIYGALVGERNNPINKPLTKSSVDGIEQTISKRSPHEIIRLNGLAFAKRGKERQGCGLIEAARKDYAVTGQQLKALLDERYSEKIKEMGEEDTGLKYHTISEAMETIDNTSGSTIFHVLHLTVADLLPKVKWVVRAGNIYVELDSLKEGIKTYEGFFRKKEQTVEEAVKAADVDKVPPEDLKAKLAKYEAIGTPEEFKESKETVHKVVVDMKERNAKLEKALRLADQ